MQVPWSRPDVAAAETRAIAGVLKSGWLGMGPVTEAAEAAIARFLGARHCVFVNNGTSALLAAYLAAGWGPGDEILVPTYTFIATVSAMVVLGCRPVLIDCDPATMNVDPEEVRRVAAEHPKAKGLVIVDVAGLSCDLDALGEIAQERQLTLVEDAAEAFGGTYRGGYLGARRHATIFSYHIAKQVTAVEGGAIVTQDGRIARACRQLRSHGEGRQKYIHPELGLNLRPTDINSAIALAQVRRTGTFLRRHRDHARRYREGLARFLNFQSVPEYATDPTWMVFQVLAHDRKTRDRLEAHLLKRGVQTRRAFPPMHQQPYLRRRFSFGKYPHADWVYDRVLSLPMGNGIRTEEIDYVIDQTVRFFRSG
ncbi:MAG: DegT/DnrJ/EryC1/StrS family aminotransferase [Thermoplasmata archaeon]